MKFILFVFFTQLSNGQVTFIVNELPQDHDYAESLYISGNFEGWSGGREELKLIKNDNEYRITLKDVSCNILFKFTLGSWASVEVEEDGANIENRSYSCEDGDNIVYISIRSWSGKAQNVVKSTAKENVKIFSENFEIPQLNRDRKIWIYLPPDYETSNKKYPVLYMHDGQNVFDIKTSYAGEWGVDETLNKLFYDSGFGMIVVAVENGQDKRSKEYIPYNFPRIDKSEGEQYINFLVQSLKPHIDANYRTLSDATNTGLMGSSLGGLITHYGVLSHPGVFGKAGVFSPSFWVSEEAYSLVKEKRKKNDLRMFFLMGEKESDRAIPDMDRMLDLMKDVGFPSTNLKRKVVKEGQHNEKLWRENFEEAIRWMFNINAKESSNNNIMNRRGKIVIYQVFTRLFGNTNTNNKPWGTLKENGVGKFNDFSEKALKEIKDLGVTHVWYTGVPHHDVITDYTEYGISNDDPDVVKGRAGSPYAVKDYYNVNPDLAVNPENRLDEFKALIERTHKAGMKLLIDIVPNHVARNYHSLTNPAGVKDFGAADDTSVTYKVNNNFYYNPGEHFQVPDWNNGYTPLGGESHTLLDNKFLEVPAKWTGNGSRLSKPGINDWYETVKINYGVRPDGVKDFDELPIGYEYANFQTHYEFWKGKNIPDSWQKFKDIAEYWLNMGVDGFRFDMAEMVPVEFWSYLNSAIKMKNPDAFLLAEVYQPHLYRDYIKRGKMDYLYDKVQLYDTLKHVMQGHGSTDNIPPIQEDLKDIEHHMLHFLENHDEQRISSTEFAGSAVKGKPAMVVSTTISTAPTMIYFGQEVGEPGAEDPGFGDPSRTSIFDYIGVPNLQRWVNDKQFDGGQSTKEELALRDFYKRLLNLSLNSSAMMGDYADIHKYNRQNTEWYNDRVLSFVRWSDEEKIIVVSNFDAENTFGFELAIPKNIISIWNLADGSYKVGDKLYEKFKQELKVIDGVGHVRVDLDPLESFILKIKN